MTDKKNSRALIIFFEDQNRDKVQRGLASNLTDAQKKLIYRAFLEDTITNCLELNGVEIRINYPTGPTGQIVNEIVNNLKKSLTGKSLKLLKSNNFKMLKSVGESIGERISNSFKHAFDSNCKKVALIGCVTPTLPRKTVTDAFKRISKYDLVIGPTLEGNFYLLATHKHLPELFAEIDWTADCSVYSQMVEACKKNEFHWDEMDIWYDLRQPEDLEFLVRDINHFRLIGDEKSAIRTEQALEEILKDLPS